MSIAFETDSALHLLDFHTVECKMSGWGSRLKARGGALVASTFLNKSV